MADSPIELPRKISIQVRAWSAIALQVIGALALVWGAWKALSG